MSALKAHPKVYWIWNHRRWCLENLPNGPGQEGDADFMGWKQSSWDKELGLVELMLLADPRNCKDSPILAPLNVAAADPLVYQSMPGIIGDTS